MSDNNIINNNIVNIKRQIDLENRLKLDAQKINDDVHDNLRAELLEKLAQQQIINPPTVSNPHSFLKNKFTIAASILLSVFVIQYSVNNQSVKQPELAQHSDQPMNSDLFLNLSAEFAKKDKLASQELNNEYKAILADMEKVKQRIIRL